MVNTIGIPLGFKNYFYIVFLFKYFIIKIRPTKTENII